MKRKVKKVLPYKTKLSKFRARKSKKASPRMVDHLIELLNVDRVPKEIKKFLVYVTERQIYGSDISNEFITFCLSSYCILSNQYAAISKIFKLLSKKHLKEVVRQMIFSPGIKDAVLNLIQLRTEHLQSFDKKCVLLIEETTVKPQLYESVKHQIVIGVEDNGVVRGKKSARFVTNIWVQCINGMWVLPLAYYFSYSSIAAPTLKNYIFESISKLNGIGLNVEAVVTKMKPNFYELSKLLKISTTNQKFHVDSVDKDVFFMFDAPHLLTVTRNNLIKYRFKFDGKEASWRYVKKFHAQENREKVKKSKLTQVHVIPDEIIKSKPQYAAQVFSNTVANEMKSFIAKGYLPNAANGTADCIEFFDKLFDILNSADGDFQNEFKDPYKGTKHQVQFLENAIKFLENLKIYDGKRDCTTLEGNFLTGWVITIKTVMQLWDILKPARCEYLLTRNLCCHGLDSFLVLTKWDISRLKDSTPIYFVKFYKQYFIVTFFNAIPLYSQLHWLIWPLVYCKKIYHRIPPTRHDIDGKKNTAVPKKP